MFSFSPLLGALSESTASQSLLEFDGGVKILIDVGWDESFDPAKLTELEKHVPSISLILLTHATVSHLAAFAHCCKHLAHFARIPVYATFPVIALGRTLLQDLYASAPRAGTVVPREALEREGFERAEADGKKDEVVVREPPTQDEIASYFANIHGLKYSQPHQPVVATSSAAAATPAPASSSAQPLTITAYNSGHTLGGTIWHLQHGLESVVYAVDWNQGRENVFAGAAWLGGAGGGGGEVIEQLRRPTALICSSRGGGAAAWSSGGGSRAKRDEALLETVKGRVRNGGTVLIPTDSAARVLELAYLLEHAWRAEAAKGDAGDWALRRTRLYLAGRNMGNTMRYARSMLEWMDDNIIREFEAVADGSKRQGGANGASGGADAAANSGGAGGTQAGGDGAKSGGGPFDFRFVRILERRSQVRRVLARANGGDAGGGGKVILASDATMSWGFSRAALRAVAADPRSLVVLTERPGLADPAAPSLARTLWGWWRDRNSTQVATPDAEGALPAALAAGRELVIPAAAREPLQSPQLEAYARYAAAQAQAKAAAEGSLGGAGEAGAALEAPDGAGAGGAGGAVAAGAGDDDDDASSESSDDSDSDDEGADGSGVQGKALTASVVAAAAAGRKKAVLSDQDLGVNVLLKRRGVFDFDVRGKKGRDRMFPLAVRRRRWDDFGEVIRPEDFLRAEEREDGQTGEGSGQQQGQNQQGGGSVDHPDTRKRKWDDVAEQLKAMIGGPGGDDQQRGGGGKRPHMGRTDTDDNSSMFFGGSGAAMHDPDLDEAAAGEDGSDDDNDTPAASGPFRLVRADEKVQAQLRIAFADLSGIHDKRSLHMLIPLVAPHKLILVGGDRDETLALAADCRRLLNKRAGEEGALHQEQNNPNQQQQQQDAAVVFAPEVGDVVNASVDTNVWTVRLTDALVRRLKWQKVRGVDVVTVTGLLLGAPSAADAVAAEADAAAANKRLKAADGDDVTAATPDDADADGPGSKDSGGGGGVKASAAPVVVVPTLDVLPATMPAGALVVASAAAKQTPQQLLQQQQQQQHAGSTDSAFSTALVSRPAASRQLQKPHHHQHLHLQAPPLHVGDLRLADLRRGLQARGHAAEFRGEGTLLVDGCVVVRKVMMHSLQRRGGGSTTAAKELGGGRVEIESVGFQGLGGADVVGLMGQGGGGGGARAAAAAAALADAGMGGTFYAVRKAVYEGLAVVAGG